jgi:multisubunit Na+/H+ antiporter MnhF subunit
MKVFVLRRMPTVPHWAVMLAAAVLGFIGSVAYSWYR